MRTPLKYILSLLLLASILYGALAALTYNTIQIKIEKLDVLEQELMEKEKQGEVSYSFKQNYKKEYDTYMHLQTRLQSFWMKWIFDFPEYKTP
ncbi:hypothetical protein JOC95_003452 [Bacillus tianshenii]|uniref:Septum formation initiator n=1 Tax=Sutcliffiella tianshenii TaxID=1463404 RepID=A0ABS2P4D1_9BACI|nr:hypothetical protein [Bacillus tianshenii]MBM7621563.1 hypothetical protein [Bacillus tianshenii]